MHAKIEHGEKARVDDVKFPEDIERRKVTVAASSNSLCGCTAQLLAAKARAEPACVGGGGDISLVRAASCSSKQPK